MTTQSNQSPYLNTNIYLDDDTVKNNIYMTMLFRDIVTVVNSKENGIYEQSEVFTGQSWFSGGNFGNRRATYRTVYNFPTLTAIGTTSIPHNLGNISTFTFTKILGTARNAAGTFHVPLPQGGPDNVMITIDANNINIVCATATYNNFSAQIILEYLKN